MSKEHEKSAFNKDVEAAFREITGKHIIYNPTGQSSCLPLT